MIQNQLKRKAKIIINLNHETQVPWYILNYAKQINEHQAFIVVALWFENCAKILS